MKILGKNKKRKVLLVSGSRGEYGYIRPVIKLMKESNILEPKILATNMHLLPEFGNTIEEFSIDNISVDYKAYMALSGFTNSTMVKSLGVFMLSVADILDNNCPDFILLAGDRGEQLIAAMAGAHMNVPIAHIQSGELSGNIDGMVRHAITRFTNIHFASNEDAKRRLISMGEEDFRTFCVGAPQLDELSHNNIADRQEIMEKYSFDSSKPIALIAQHPVTEQAIYAGEQMEATMNAVISLGLQCVVIYPNNDAGSISIQECIKNCHNINIKFERNTSRDIYAGIMKSADVIIGNSSSGIIEAPSFELPAVNIGRRQNGRYQSKNVINVRHHDPKAIKMTIKKALSPKFKKSLKGMKNPYGDGRSAERIVEILETVPINEKLLYKKIAY